MQEVLLKYAHKRDLLLCLQSTRPPCPHHLHGVGGRRRLTTEHKVAGNGKPSAPKACVAVHRYLAPLRSGDIVHHLGRHGWAKVSNHSASVGVKETNAHGPSLLA